MSKLVIKNNINSELVITHVDNKPAKRIVGSDITVAVDTINDFPLIASDGDTVIVRDLNRGGTFIYDSSKIAEHNDGTNFNGWIRQYDGAVNVKWFGAKGDGINDDALSIQLTINSSEAGTLIFIPDGVYALSKTIVINKTLKISMEASDLNSRFLFNTAIPKTVQTYSTHPNDGTDIAISAGIVITAPNVELDNVIVDLFVDYSDTSSTNFGIDNDVGILIRSVSGTKLKQCRTRGYWRKAGLMIDNTQDNSTADRTSLDYCRFQGFWSMLIQGAKVKSGETEISSDDKRGAGGISDLHSSRVWFEGWNHHSKVRVSDTDGGCLYIDGKLYKGISNINAIQGRLWLNCRFSGADPYFLKIGNAIQDNFLHCFIDRQTGYKKVDGTTEVGTHDCEISLGAGSKAVKFRDTAFYNVTRNFDINASYEISGAIDSDLLVLEESFTPALAYGTSITYSKRNGYYHIKDNIRFFRVVMEVSNSDNTDGSQVQITMPEVLDNVYVNAEFSYPQSTFFKSTGSIGILDNGYLALYNSDGSSLKYSDCNSSGNIYITGFTYI